MASWSRFLLLGSVGQLATSQTMGLDIAKIRASHKRYNQSPKGKARKLRYNQSPEGKAAQSRYDASSKGKARDARYRNSGGREQEKFKKLSNRRLKRIQERMI